MTRLKILFNSLRFKLVMATVVVEITMLTILVWNSSRLINKNLALQTVGHLQEMQPLLNASIAGPLLQEDYARLAEVLEQVVNKENLRYIAVRDATDRLFIERGTRYQKQSAVVSGSKRTLEQHLLSSSGDQPYTFSMPIKMQGRTIGRIIFQYETRLISSAIRQVRQQGITVATLEIVFSVLLLLLIGATLTRHLRELTNAVKLIPETRKFSLDIHSNDEVGDLCSAFRQMTMELNLRDREREELLKELSEREQNLRTLTENAHDGILVNLDGRHVFANRYIADMLGYTVDEIRNTGIDDLVHPDERRKVLDRFKARMNDKNPQNHYETLFVSKNGDAVPVEITAAKTLWHGRPAGMVIVRDITRRKEFEKQLQAHQEHLEELVRNRTRELEQTNKELEAFSYSVSHDLRAPLRGIGGFSQLLIDEYTHQLDSEGQDYLNRVHAAAIHMSRLIDDLLQLSKITKLEMRVKPIDMSALVEAVVARQRDKEPQREVEVRIQPGMQAQGDPNLVEIAMHNLVENAWKYTQHVEHAKVEIGCTTEDGVATFFVRDNGAGFDMDYAEKLFGPFQRLHTQQEFEGTGIGLATVARIVQRHHGRIWARAEKNKGAVFYFTLG